MHHFAQGLLQEDVWISPDRAHWLVDPKGRRNQSKVAAFRDRLLAEVETEEAREPAAIF